MSMESSTQLIPRSTTFYSTSLHSNRPWTLQKQNDYILETEERLHDRAHLHKAPGNANRRRSNLIFDSGNGALKRQSRRPPPDTVLTASASNDANGPQTASRNQIRHSMPVSGMAPKKSSNVVTIVHPVPALEIRTDITPPADAASICHSPTWEDEKTRKKQSGWNWRRASLARPKKEDDKPEQHVKPLRKLSKKPPPAMGTQWQSATLTENPNSAERPQMRKRRSSSGSFTQAMRGFLSRRSSQSISPEISRRNSVNALAARSLESNQVSQAQNPTPVVVAVEASSQNPNVVAMPGQVWERSPVKQRQQQEHPLDDMASKSDDEQYVNDIAEFVNEIEASARAALYSDKPQKSNPLRSKTDPTPLTTPPQSRGEDSVTAFNPHSRYHLPRSSSIPTSVSSFPGKKDNTTGAYKYPDIRARLLKGAPSAPPSSSFSSKTKTSTNALRQTLPAEGSGYVRRERMISQQRSIARYEDEVAVTAAYNAFILESQFPPTPKDSTESVPSVIDATKSGQFQLPIAHQRSTNDLSRKTADEPSSRQANRDAVSTQHESMNNPSTGSFSSSRFPEQRSRAESVPEAPQLQTARIAVACNKNSNPSLKLSSQVSIPPLEKQPSPTTHQPNPRLTRQVSLIQIKSKASRESVRQSPVSATSAKSDSTGALEWHPLSRNISPKYQSQSVSTSQKGSPPLGHGVTSSSASSPSAVSPSEMPLLRISSAERRPPPKSPLPPLPTMAKNQFLIASENAEGILRKTSIKRHRSDPELKVPELRVEPTAENPLPSFDFLPELKHQPLPKRASRVSSSPDSPSTASSISKFSIPSPPMEVARRVINPPRSSKQSSGVLTTRGPAKPIAKMFVICCKCKFWHDLPSKVYEAMALPQTVGRDDDIAAGPASSRTRAALLEGEAKGFEGKIYTHISCPWCEHAMSTSCCEGWTTVIYLHERHH